MAISKSVNLAHAQTAVPCNVCEDETPGEYYCIECKHTLCPPCEKYHRKFTKGHNVVLRTQIGDIDTTILTCTDHGDTASFHCEKCNIPVCGKCITGEHRGHVMSDLSVILDREKEILQNEIRRMQQNILPKLEIEKEHITTQKKMYENRIIKISKDMESENNDIQKQVYRILDDRIKRLSEMRESDLSTFDICSIEIQRKIDFVKRRTSEYEDALGRNSLPVIINLVKMKKALPELRSKFDLPQPPLFEPGSMQKIVDGIENVQVPFPLRVVHQIGLTAPSIISKFKSPLKGYPSIFITKEGEVWLGGYDSKELVMIDIKGHVLRKRRIKYRPRALTSTENCDVIISPHIKDSSSVIRLFANDLKICIFDTSPSCSIGLSNTSDQKILISTQDGRVEMTNGNGVYVKQIYKGSGDWSALHAVEDKYGNIFISDWTSPSVLIIDKNGTVLSKITHSKGGQKLGKPKGLVLDKMGNILCADDSNDCIYIIDQNQEITELVGRVHGIKAPRWLAVDTDNRLWITQIDGTIIALEYLA